MKINMNKWLYWAEEEIQVGTGWFFGVPIVRYAVWRWLQEGGYSMFAQYRVVGAFLKSTLGTIVAYFRTRVRCTWYREKQIFCQYLGTRVWVWDCVGKHDPSSFAVLKCFLNSLKNRTMLPKIV
jgi:hypothetical protein